MHPLMLGKPGLDGHSNGAEQIATRARDCGMAVTYQGIRQTPAEIVSAAEQGAHVLGLSILSGSHLELVAEVMALMQARGLRIPVVVGGGYAEMVDNAGYAAPSSGYANVASGSGGAPNDDLMTSFVSAWTVPVATSATPTTAVPSTLTTRRVMRSTPEP